MTKLNYTAAELKTAYQIVADHLFTELLKASEGQTVRLGALGKFTKRVRKTRMGWTNQDYLYYNLTFKPFTKLKTALDHSLTRKYDTG